MRKTIFELERRTNLATDYDDLLTELNQAKVHTQSLDTVVLYRVLNESIKAWPYRQAAIDIASFADKHHFEFFTPPTDNDIISSLELLLNLFRWAPKYDFERGNPLAMMAFYSGSGLEQECQRCFENVEYILERLNMRVRKKEYEPIPQYVISKRDKNLDAVIETVPELSETLLSYFDVRNSKDEYAKKSILKTIAEYLEPIRFKYKGSTYSTLCDDLFTTFNMAGIRHNNEKQWKLRKADRMKLYDQTFKAAIHLIQMEEILDYKNWIKELKECALK